MAGARPKLEEKKSDFDETLKKFREFHTRSPQEHIQKLIEGDVATWSLLSVAYIDMPYIEKIISAARDWERVKNAEWKNEMKKQEEQKGQAVPADLKHEISANELAMLGRIYLLRKENEKAIQYLEAAALLGNSNAEYSLFSYFEDKDKEKAQGHLNRALAAENPRALNHQGYVKELEKNLPEAIDFHQRAAKAGEPGSLHALGSIYREENTAKANDYYKMAARAGHLNAIHNLGNDYYNGKVMERDLNKYFAALNARAEFDPNPSAYLLYELALLYKDGIPKRGEKNYLKASHLLAQALLIDPEFKKAKDMQIQLWGKGASNVVNQVCFNQYFSFLSRAGTMADEEKSRPFGRTGPGLADDISPEQIYRIIFPYLSKDMNANPHKGIQRAAYLKLKAGLEHGDIYGSSYDSPSDYHKMHYQVAFYELRNAPAGQSDLENNTRDLMLAACYNDPNLFSQVLSRMTPAEIDQIANQDTHKLRSVEAKDKKDIQTAFHLIALSGNAKCLNLLMAKMSSTALATAMKSSFQVPSRNDFLEIKTTGLWLVFDSLGGQLFDLKLTRKMIDEGTPRYLFKDLFKKHSAETILQGLNFLSPFTESLHSNKKINSKYIDQNPMLNDNEKLRIKQEYDFFHTLGHKDPAKIFMNDQQKWFELASSQIKLEKNKGVVPHLDKWIDALEKIIKECPIDIRFKDKLLALHGHACLMLYSDGKASPTYLYKAFGSFNQIATPVNLNAEENLMVGEELTRGGVTAEYKAAFGMTGNCYALHEKGLRFLKAAADSNNEYADELLKGRLYQGDEKLNLQDRFEAGKVDQKQLDELKDRKAEFDTPNWSALNQLLQERLSKSANSAEDPILVRIAKLKYDYEATPVTQVEKRLAALRELQNLGQKKSSGLFKNDSESFANKVSGLVEAGIKDFSAGFRPKR